MATFTTTLAEIAEDFDMDSVMEMLDKPEMLGLGGYPIFDEGYRRELNEKIIRRYWNREIGFETVEMFRFRMYARMAEIMPYYNQLYNSEKLVFDPLSTMDLETNAGSKANSRNKGTSNVVSAETGSKDSEHEETGTNISTNSADSGSRQVNSTTPQNQLSGNGDYADSMSDNNTTTTNTSNSNTSGEGTEGIATQNDGTTDAETASEGEQIGSTDSRTKGYQAVPSDLLQKYRDTFLNIDLMVVERVASLFMAVTSSGDEYFYEQMPLMSYGWLGTYY